MPLSKAHASLGLPRLFVFRLPQEHDVAEEVSGFETRGCSELVNTAQLMFLSIYPVHDGGGRRGERAEGAMGGLYAFPELIQPKVSGAGHMPRTKSSGLCKCLISL